MDNWAYLSIVGIPQTCDLDEEMPTCGENSCVDGLALETLVHYICLYSPPSLTIICIYIYTNIIYIYVKNIKGVPGYFPFKQFLECCLQPVVSTNA